MKRLSDRAELLLGLVRESCTFDDMGEPTMFFVPKAYPYYGTIYGECVKHGFLPYGSDAQTFKSFERKGLVRKMTAADYSYCITEDGIQLYEEIAERRRAGDRKLETEERERFLRDREKAK